ncbi:hypothetical protein AMEX_G24002 [Astyanax mexicanus]|uniref:Uncharacterized protein n=1 Tax=Astyanax mexicanus TaxID=7994 RepID=A0A8T2KUB3_ASTMX|nr:hypothetical protein AMEX_G24002 [Astyanax mexicanus]
MHVRAIAHTLAYTGKTLSMGTPSRALSTARRKTSSTHSGLPTATELQIELLTLRRLNQHQMFLRKRRWPGSPAGMGGLRKKHQKYAAGSAASHGQAGWNSSKPSAQNKEFTQNQELLQRCYT